LKIDIWIPEFKLGIEANGEEFHNHTLYTSDKINGTVNSDEMYKQYYCEMKGIKLIHVWDSDSDNYIYNLIDREIASRKTSHTASLHDSESVPKKDYTLKVIIAIPGTALLATLYICLPVLQIGPNTNWTLLIPCTIVVGIIDIFWWQSIKK
jgi:hypothetical protein